MAVSSSGTASNHRGRRTNSLGYAKHDCHTCSTLRRVCDRQRPRCGPCLSSHEKCGGFATNLVWKDVRLPGLAEVGAQESGSRAPDSPGGHCQNDVPRKERGFKFVKGRMKRKRKPKTLSPELELPSTPTDAVDSSQNSPDSQSLNRLPSWFANSEDIISPSMVTQERCSTTNLHYDGITIVFDQLQTPRSTGSDDLPSTSSASSNATSPLSIMLSHTIGCPQTSDFAIAERDDFFTNDDCSNTWSPPDSSEPATDVGDERAISERQYRLTPGICYQDSVQKYEALLTMYDEEFCMFPLTMDCLTNPFRVRTYRAEGSEFLLHAIIAVSSQHLAKRSNRPELNVQVHNHRSTATHLFTRALCQSNPATLLDALLILVSLDLTQSAFSTSWGIHLAGARRLLEAAGALKICRHNARMRAQVAFLVRWDVTLAFLSREDLRLPLAYLEMLMKCGDSPDCSFFVLNGCSLELVMYMARLAKLAGIYEKTRQMEWTIFDRSAVDQVIAEVTNFVNKEDSTLEDISLVDDDPNTNRDRFHCIEAWRNAILLYTCRVFAPQQDSVGIRKISHLARVTLDHVRCISRRSFIQKQVLLPVFLAGSEVDDEQDRSFIREYCRHWSDAARFYMFESTRILLEDIWKDWDPTERDSYWWGIKVGGGNVARSNDEDELATQVLLG